MKLQTNLPKQAIDAIDFLQESDGEAGWVVYLADGWSFDPMSSDGSRFIPLDSWQEAKQLVVFSVGA